MKKKTIPEKPNPTIATGFLWGLCQDKINRLHIKLKREKKKINGTKAKRHFGDNARLSIAKAIRE